MINYLLFTISMIAVNGTKLNPKGPVHITYAVDCLEELALDQFNYRETFYLKRNKGVSSRLLTILTTSNITSPGFEIQQMIVKKLQNKFNIEVITNERIDFGLEMYTSYCLVVTDNIESFEEKLSVFSNLTSFDPEALFLVYFSKLDKHYKEKATLILNKLWKRSVVNALVLLPKTLRSFVIYSLELNMKTSHRCLDSVEVVVLDYCVEGLVKNKKNYYEFKHDLQFQNCTLDVVATKIKPFVINETDGFEIRFIKQIGQVLNVSFNITLSDDDSWGMKDENGKWTNGLKSVYENSSLGIGNFYVTPEYDAEFDYTVSYFISDLVWIVPIAQYVPKWRVLAIIFSWYLWVLCICSIFLTAIFLKILSFSKKEVQSYKYLGNDFVIALGIILFMSVNKQPKTEWTRLPFLALAIFSIIIGAVYTSSLINYLTYPQREPQVRTIDAVLEKGWAIGGLPVNKKIFEETEDRRSMKIYNMFQVSETFDTWLQKAADDHNAVTIANKFFIEYMLAKEDPIVTDQKGKPKIFILENKIFSYSIVIVSNKAFPFLERINYVIGVMNTHGLVKAMSQKYCNMLDKVKSTDDTDGFVQALKLDHLQGAFAILIMGCILGLLSFLMEIVIHLSKLKLKKRNNKNIRL